MNTGRKIFLVVSALIVFLIMMIALCAVNHQVKLRREA